MPRSCTAAFEQQGADRVRHAADADLQAGAVLDLGGDEAADGAVDIGDRRRRELGGRRAVTVDDDVDLTHVDAVVDTVAERQLVVHLDDHGARRFDDRADATGSRRSG